MLFLISSTFQAQLNHLEPTGIQAVPSPVNSIVGAPLALLVVQSSKSLAVFFPICCVCVYI